MPAEDLSDDYVATLLKADAQITSKQYAQVGISALLPKRPTGAAPKPNVRFLNNLLRETQGHNAALLAKEADEAKAKLKDFKRERTGEDSGKSRRDRKRRRVDEDGDRKRERRRDRSSHRLDDQDRRKDKSRRDDSHNDSHDDKSRSRRSKHDGSRSKHSDRHRENHKSSRRHRSPSNSQSRSRSRSPARSRRHHKSSRHRRRSKSPTQSPPRARHKRRKQSPSPSRASDSDPLEALIGPPPPPPVQRRGRGAFSKTSTLDAHFADDYDPAADVAPASDDDDWEQSIEAMQARARWRQQGAERLRLAGFTDEQVKRWETGDEKTADDVKWARKGEGREWDRGKVVGDDGDVGIDLEWGRLKGT
ncbi:hypothetical protein BT63DRAFT_22580 [Microthyrium microscopicum]|uniref:Pre-mRNA-splicing factor 38B n=1 Tax=Microthyrium microscopicum TaxID=703497 RepID=A0A6A6UTQ4_9PEZI|nr:hypothetical protein BT63DRAFT_22580 [Microthyrium microscopicum]